MIRILILGLIALSACSHKPVIETRPPTSTVPEAPSTPAASPTPTPGSAGAFRGGVGISCDSSCTKAERDELPKLEKIVADTIAGDCFEKYITDPKNGLDLNQSLGLTAAQVVKKLRDNRVLFTLEYYFEKPNWWTGTGVVGSREGDVISANRYYYADYTACEKGSNLEHEASHILEFDHDFNATRRRPYSVPYMINAAFDACCKP